MLVTYASSHCIGVDIINTGCNILAHKSRKKEMEKATGHNGRELLASGEVTQWFYRIDRQKAQKFHNSEKITGILAVLRKTIADAIG